MPYFADMPVNLRALACRHMEAETVEGDSVIFLEDDEADYLYVVMSGSVGVHILDKKSKELMKQAKAANLTPEEIALEQRRQTEKQNKSAALSLELTAAGVAEEEEKPKKSEDELLAEQMQRDAEAEVARLFREKEELKLKKKKRQEDEDDTDDEEDEDESESESLR